MIDLKFRARRKALAALRRTKLACAAGCLLRVARRAEVESCEEQKKGPISRDMGMHKVTWKFRPSLLSITGSDVPAPLSTALALRQPVLSCCRTAFLILLASARRSC